MGQLSENRARKVSPTTREGHMHRMRAFPTTAKRGKASTVEKRERAKWRKGKKKRKIDDDDGQRTKRRLSLCFLRCTLFLVARNTGNRSYRRRRAHGPHHAHVD